MAPKQKTKVQTTLLSFFGGGTASTPVAKAKPAVRPAPKKTKATTRATASPKKKVRVAKPVPQPVEDDDVLFSDFEDVEEIRTAATGARRAVIESDSEDEFIAPDEELEDLDAVLQGLNEGAPAAGMKTPGRAAVASIKSPARSPTTEDEVEVEQEQEDHCLGDFSPTSPPQPRGRRPKAAMPAPVKEVGRFSFMVDRKDLAGRRPGEEGYDSNTLLITPGQMSKLTNFEQQFWGVKQRNMDTVILFKKGKFYEMFEQDADVGHRELDLRITERVNMRMTGVPEAGWERWAARLLARGYRVGRVEQVGTAAQATKQKAKIIKRELVEVLTGGTVADPAMVPTRATTYLLALAEDPASTTDAPAYGYTLLNASSGVFHVGSAVDTIHLDTLRTILHQTDPREVLLSPTINAGVATFIRRRLGRLASPFDAPEDAVATMLGLGDGRTVPDVVKAHPRPVGMVFGYLKGLKLLPELLANGSWVPYDVTTHGDALQLDVSSMENLAVLANEDGGVRGTLLEYLGRTSTAMGHRLLRTWLCRPLRRLDAIKERQDAVRALHGAFPTHQAVVAALDPLPDLERLFSRGLAGKLGLAHFVRLLDGLEACSAVRAAVEPLPSPALQEFVSSDMWDALDAMQEHYTAAFDRERAAAGALEVTPGAHAGFDAASALVRELESRLAAELDHIQQSFPEAGYEHLQAEGYQVVLPPKVTPPDDWKLMSRTKAKARYWPPAVQRLVTDHTVAKDELKDVQAGMLSDFQRAMAKWRGAVTDMLNGIAQIDLLAAFATVAATSPVTVCLPDIQPEVTKAGDAFFTASELRHPAAAASGAFIPNDVTLGGPAPSVTLLTGPNLGGKSTVLRQVCLAVILGQVGAFVPAAECSFTVADAVLTRCGARDMILSGQSTLHVELAEAARILHQATPNTVAILDELGRGASAVDGHALGFAAVTAIAAAGYRCLFATHDHALVRDVAGGPDVSPCFMDCAVDDASGDIRFFYTLRPGILNKSFGPNVAQLAGVPLTIVRHAQQLSAEREAQEARSVLMAAIDNADGPDGAAYLQTRAAEWVRLTGE